MSGDGCVWAVMGLTEGARKRSRKDTKKSKPENPEEVKTGSKKISRPVDTKSATGSDGRFPP